MDKRSSLLRKLVNYGHKSFITLAPGFRPPVTGPKQGPWLQAPLQGPCLQAPGYRPLVTGPRLQVPGYRP
jgi:hypothetical protein